MRRFFSFWAAGLASVLLLATPAASMVVNGSFEVGPALNSLHFFRGPPGPTGWSQVGALEFADIIGPGFGATAPLGALPLLTAQDGSRFVDMNGATPSGGLFQDITGLPVGATAQLSFWAGRWQQNNAGSLLAALIDPANPSVLLDSETISIVFDNTVTSSLWVLHMIDAIVPASGALRIQFTANSNDSNRSAVGVDNVSLSIATSEVPLPAALPLFASVLGVFGFLTWRRRSQSALPGAVIATRARRPDTSRPLGDRRHRGEDRVDIAAGA